MTETSHHSESEDLRAEARAWLRRLNSGEATASDVEALAVWRARSPAHSKSFAEASLLWSLLGQAAELAEQEHPVPAAVSERFRPARRAFLFGGGALAASLAGVSIIRPPANLWPALGELTADYRTRTGERQQIEIAGSVSVDMNTKTSIDVLGAGDNRAEIELLSGEAAIVQQNASRTLVVAAGEGRATAINASFNIRKDGGLVRVTCVSGEVQVQCKTAETSIREGQEVAYDATGLGAISSVDSGVTTAWRRGMLIFRRISLADVIEEVNRYRSGRILLLDSKLARRQVVGNFRLDRINDVIAFIAEAMDIPIRFLPGGIVLVG